MRRIMRLLAIIVVAYLLIVVLVVTPALNLVPSWYVKKYLGRDLDIGWVLFNPFALSLHVKDAELLEPDGERFAGLAGAEVNLSVESLWQPGWVLDAFKVDQLYLHVRKLTEDSFNFSDLIPPGDDAPAEPEGELPGVTIRDFEFSSERLMYTDETRVKPYNTVLDGLAIHVADLSTVFEEGKPYRLEATGEGGGRLQWEGLVSLPKSHSEGSLSLIDIQLPVLWRFIEPWVSFELTEGTASVTGQYNVDWAEPLAYSIRQGEVRLAGIAVQPASADAPADTSVALGELVVAGIDLDGANRQVVADSLTVDGLAVEGWSEGSKVSLVELFSMELPAGDEVEQAPADDAGWTAELSTIQVKDNSLRWRSEFTDPALLEVSPVEATVQDIKWPLAGDSPVELSLTINGQTTVSVEGSLGLAEGQGKLSYDLQALPLTWFNPNFPAALRVKLTDGQLGVKGEVSLAEWSPTIIRATGAIDGFNGLMEGEEASLTSWESVRWDELAVDLEQRSVALAKLSIDNYTGRLHIRKDGSINAQNLWAEELHKEEAEAEGQAGATGPDATAGKIGQEGEEPAGTEHAQNGQKSPETGEQAQPESPAPGDEPPWSVTIPEIQITDSQIDFMDESLPIVFRTVIGDINGDISGLNSAADAEARVDIKGSVDSYAPVALSGTAQPLSEPPAIDLLLTFDGIDLAMLSPYSATYAGYRIDRGLLDLDLKYSLKDHHLAGNNKVLIDKMKLGEKVESDKAADIPLELALTLLTDINGVIDLEVPVSGNLDDPEFSLGGVIWGAFLNLITKAVTAPFNLLASLVGSEENLQRVKFASGSAELDQAGRDKLDQLGQALAQRPQLGLVVSGRLQPEADREYLQRNILRAELLEAGLSKEQLDSKGPDWEQAIIERYQRLTPGATGRTVTEQAQQLAAAIPLPDDAMANLARERAAAVKTYLINEVGLDPGRAVIEQVKPEDPDNRYSGVELAIDT